jgi:hypothetical protein
MRKSERINLFFRQLSSVEPCSDHDQAYRLIESTLNAIEDKYSGVAFDPGAWKTDGRIYLPQADRSFRSTEHHDVVKYQSLGHWTFIAANGAFLIHEIQRGKVVVDRPGLDGRAVEAFVIKAK